jgi:putative tryptophan/tyrosine transport system substrate-binding protein
MKRRDFVTLIGIAAAARPLSALAQSASKKIPVVGVLWHAANADEEGIYLKTLHKAFRDLGGRPKH